MCEIYAMAEFKITREKLQLEHKEQKGKLEPKFNKPLRMST
jgi:hypothetical protein